MKLKAGMDVISNTGRHGVVQNNQGYDDNPFQIKLPDRNVVNFVDSNGECQYSKEVWYPKITHDTDIKVPFFECPACGEVGHDTQPSDGNNIDYFVCQDCGFRIEQDSYRMIAKMYISHSGPQYEVRLGKFGSYIYDKVNQRDVTLEETADLLNEIPRAINALTGGPRGLPNHIIKDVFTKGHQGLMERRIYYNEKSVLCID